jgi:CheY-like chemotaxis protein
MDRPPANRRRVLYVEDHPVNAMLMSALFESRPGLKLVVAGTGEQALQLIAGLQPVLLLLDLHLPDCHGTQLLPLLRLHAKDAPAVAVTADPDFDLSHSGFCELWAKPLDLPRVLERLDALTSPSDTARPPLDVRRELASAHADGGRAARSDHR